MTALVTGMNSIIHSHPMANGARSGSTNSAAPSTISANDFLSLLVTEMKNQDPTAQTDPNEYVNQLVQVNSLEQLIEINENLTNALSGGTVGAQSAPSGARMNAAHLTGTLDGASAIGQGSPKGTSSPVRAPNPVAAAAGNLGTSKPSPAAQRVAQALSGRL